MHEVREFMKTKEGTADVSWPIWNVICFAGIAQYQIGFKNCL